MKSAEEWANILNEIGPDELTIDTVQQIQLDAMKEGMRRAADGLSFNTNHRHSDIHPTVFVMFPDGSMGVEPNYLDSYDTIIPLIQKQPQAIQDLMGEYMCRMGAFKYRWFWQGTPSQLCEALLRATGKWTN